MIEKTNILHHSPGSWVTRWKRCCFSADSRLNSIFCKFFHLKASGWGNLCACYINWTYWVQKTINLKLLKHFLRIMKVKMD